MKKPSILLFILLSLQLYGCSNHLPDSNETVLSAPESPSPKFESTLAEVNDTKVIEMTAEEFHDDNSSISAETENNPAPFTSAETENTDDSPQSTTSQPEESITAIDNGYYSVATNIPSTEVERYAAQVKQQFLEQDWSAISSEISYPITISDVTYKNSTEFLNASSSFDSNLDNAFFSALEYEDCVEMFCNYEGIMIGEAGQIWIGEVLNSDFTSQGLKIITINGLLKK